MTSRRKLVPRSSFLVVTAILSAPPALANESKFSFTMVHRYVSGKDNSVKHDMDSGTLTVSGELWTTHCELINEETGKRAAPALVTIEVVGEGLLRSPECSFSVPPSPTIGKKVPFEITCSNIKKTSIYLIAYHTIEDDRCAIEAAGKLKTK